MKGLLLSSTLNVSRMKSRNLKSSDKRRSILKLPLIRLTWYHIPYREKLRKLQLSDYTPKKCRINFKYLVKYINRYEQPGFLIVYRCFDRTNVCDSIVRGSDLLYFHFFIIKFEKFVLCRLKRDPYFLIFPHRTKDANYVRNER